MVKKDVEIPIGSHRVPVKLTLETLRSLEEALEVSGLRDLLRIIVSPSAEQLLIIVGVFVKEAGSTELSDSFKNEEIDLQMILSRIMDLFRPDAKDIDIGMDRATLENLIADHNHLSKGATS